MKNLKQYYIKTARLMALTVLSVLMLGCPDLSGLGDGGPPFGGGKKLENPNYEFYFSLDPPYHEIDAGQWGLAIEVIFLYGYDEAPKYKPVIIGPGSLYVFYSPIDDSGKMGDTIFIPFDDLETVYGVTPRGRKFLGYYRPPSNDDVPPEGLDVTFAFEVLNTLTDKWERSPNYTRRVIQRNKPMDFHIYPLFGSGESPLLYGKWTGIEYSYRKMVAGETFGFYIEGEPLPAEGFQMEHDLTGPEGYSGNPGELKIRADNNLRQDKWFCDYTAPEDITSPIDIVFLVSAYDPWVKERIIKELTFHVVPK